jgi:hypothetical protein
MDTISSPASTNAGRSQMAAAWFNLLTALVTVRVDR